MPKPDRVRLSTMVNIVRKLSRRIVYSPPFLKRVENSRGVRQSVDRSETKHGDTTPSAAYKKSILFPLYHAPPRSRKEKPGLLQSRVLEISHKKMRCEPGFILSC